MIIRKLNYLNLETELKMMSLELLKDHYIRLVYSPKNGYAVYSEVNNIQNDFFLIKTDNVPGDFNQENPEIQADKSEFVQIITAIIDNIYKDKEIKEYEKKHPEYVLMELLDKLSLEDAETITKDNPIYEDINDGFLRLNVDQMMNNNSTIPHNFDDFKNILKK